jgi:hypothetical protein
MSSLVRRTVWRDIDFNLAEAIGRDGFVGRAVPTQQDTNPGQQLADTEWLGQVVVGAGIEGLDLVVFGRTGRETQDRQ